MLCYAGLRHTTHDSWQPSVWVAVQLAHGVRYGANQTPNAHGANHQNAQKTAALGTQLGGGSATLHALLKEPGLIGALTLLQWPSFHVHCRAREYAMSHRPRVARVTLLLLEGGEGIPL